MPVVKIHAMLIEPDSEGYSDIDGFYTQRFLLENG
ncbi:hypothetical protein JOC75_000662 [Metabacillus crassostreae]|nr:hypothetical protein [Metabacillus crassostreae]